MGKTTDTKKRHKIRLYHEQKGLCYYCKTPMLLSFENYEGMRLPVNLLTLDHIIPTGSGGPRAPSTNCVAACWQCNNDRGTMDARAFLLMKMGV